MEQAVILDQIVQVSIWIFPVTIGWHYLTILNAPPQPFNGFKPPIASLPHICIFSFSTGHISQSHTIHWSVEVHHGIGLSSLLCAKGWISSARKNVIDPVFLHRCLYKPLYRGFQPVLTTMPPSSVSLCFFCFFLFNLSWYIVIQLLAYLDKEIEMHMVSSNGRCKVSTIKLSQT